MLADDTTEGAAEKSNDVTDLMVDSSDIAPLNEASMNESSLRPVGEALADATHLPPANSPSEATHLAAETDGAAPSSSTTEVPAPTDESVDDAPEGTAASVEALLPTVQLVTDRSVAVPSQDVSPPSDLHEGEALASGHEPERPQEPTGALLLEAVSRPPTAAKAVKSASKASSAQHNATKKPVRVVQRIGSATHQKTSSLSQPVQPGTVLSTSQQPDGTSSPALLATSYRIGSASRPTTSHSVASTTAASPSRNRSPPTFHSKPQLPRQLLSASALREFVGAEAPFDVSRILDTSYPQLSLPTCDSGVEGTTCTHEASLLRDLMAQANVLLASLPQTLHLMAANDTNRNRSLLRSCVAFLTLFESSVERPVAPGEQGFPEKFRRPTTRQSAQLQHADKQLTTFLSPPTIVQIIRGDGFLDVARQAQDGSNKITLHRVPLGVGVTAANVEEKRRALQGIEEEITRYCKSSFDGHDSVASPVGSPVKAVQASRLANESSTPPVGGTAVSSAHAQLQKLLTAQRSAAQELAMEHEHRALVQVVEDTALALMKPSGGTAFPGVRKKDVVSSPAGALGEMLPAMLGGLQAQIDKVDRHLRQLHNTPSELAVSSQHKKSRLVTVDKEEVLLRDREVLRNSYEIVQQCAAERHSVFALFDEERRCFAQASRSLKSSTQGRDDELRAKSWAAHLMRATLEETLSENTELRRMLGVLLDHVDQLESRIQYSKRVPPQPSVFPSLQVASSHSGRSSPLDGLTSRAHSHVMQTSSPPPAAAAGGGGGTTTENTASRNTSPLNRGKSPTLETAARASASRLRTPSPSEEILFVAPDLAMPRRLSTIQQGDLNRRLHDEHRDLRRSYDSLVRSRRHTPTTIDPPCCTRTHEQFTPKRGDNIRGEGDDRDDESPYTPTPDEINKRLYYEVKDRRRQLYEKLFHDSVAAESEGLKTKRLRLRDHKFATAEEAQQMIDKLYTSSLKHKHETRERLFQELIMAREAEFLPKKVDKVTLDGIVDRLSKKN